MKTAAERIQEGMRIRALRQVDLVDRTGISKGALSSYLSGRYVPKQDNICKLAAAMNVSEAWLLGYEVPMDRATVSRQTGTAMAMAPDFRNPDLLEDALNISNVLPIHTQKIPLIGSISCGEPVYADQERESFVSAGADLNADCCLRASGDSMTGARILDGDIVFIRLQPTVDDGEIAAVIIDDEATLKRVYYDKKAGILQLVAENPAYRPMFYVGEDLEKVRILGKAVAFQSELR